MVASNRFVSSAVALTPDEVLQGPTLAERRARTINPNLLYVVCQNQTIDDAIVPFARDPHVLVRERLVLVDADEQAVDFIAARYGNFNFLNLPLQLNILALWTGPALFRFIGAIGLSYWHTDRAMKQPPTSLKAIEQQRLDEPLSERSPTWRFG